MRTNQVSVQCSVCATEWTVKASRATQNKAITCSPNCLSVLRSRNIVAFRGSEATRVAACKTCGTSFTRKPSQLEKYATSYCSRACKTISMIGERPDMQDRLILDCEMCGEPVVRTAATLRDHTYCSRLCANRDARLRTPRPNQSGEKHWRWKGGVSFLPYAPGWTKALRVSVRQRDGYTCQACLLETREPGLLVVHHRDWAKTNHDPGNLITLCRSCHSRVHLGKIQLPD
jgi:endogenous inhibitor of DNA gyrase (YacG/DUF329 family)